MFCPEARLVDYEMSGLLQSVDKRDCLALSRRAHKSGAHATE